MQSLFRALLGAGVLAVHVSALAGVAGTIATTLKEVQSPVSYGGVAAFDVTVTNKGSNVANTVTFSGTATVGSFRSVEGSVTCSGGGASVSCNLGQMRPGDTYAFSVLFDAPQPPSDSTLAFNTLTRYSEGGNGPKSKPLNSEFDLSDTVDLTAPSGANVASVVPGGAEFTLGTVKGDGFSTTVTVPQLLARTTAKIDEAPFAPVCDNFNLCLTSTVTIPGDFSLAPHLSIVLHQDELNIRKGTQIGSVVIYYTPDVAANEQPVGPCPDATTPLFNGRPCIARAVHYKSKSVDGWTEDLDGDMVWWLLNTLNGSYRLP